LVTVTYWKDAVHGEIGKIDVEAFPYTYRVGPTGIWLMMVAAEDKVVEANKLVNIKIERVEIPHKTIVFPCMFLRCALGVVMSLVGVGVPKKIEESRYADEVLFLPISDGKISKGELLSVLNMFYVSPEYRFTDEAKKRWVEERYRFS